MLTPPLRAAARVIALDDDQRVLLLRYDENGGFWATPGGALNKGEDHITALHRELREELGVGDAAVDLGEQVAERSQDHQVGDRNVRQVERYYRAHLAPSDIDPARATQPDSIRGSRWWTLDELRTTRETVYPLGLSDLVSGILTVGVPERLVVLR
jgi:ADP-ribose pyrophosphatase YjhB (NUDIX family)